MNSFILLITVLGLFQTPPQPEPSVPVVEQSPRETLTRVAQSADAQLQQSIAELNALRELVTAEKLPLAAQLTAAEAKSTTLRKEGDRLQQEADQGSLDLVALKAESKARQEELAYVSNILDEYARSFEQKVHPTELQHLGEAIARAKQATENNALTADEKFTTQLDFATLTLNRVQDSIGGMRFAGVGVDADGTVLDGQFALLGPVALFRANSGFAGVVLTQTGSDKPLIRPLEGPMQESLAGLVATGTGTMPLDPSRGGALKALVQKTNIVHIFVKGGPIMWPLLAASILALATVLERIFFLLNEQRKRSARANKRFFDAVYKGDLALAVQTSQASQDCVLRVVGYALEHRDVGIDDAIAYAQSREMKRFRRGIAILDTVITLAPLLGLLGTVTGMMGSFAVIGGDLSAPGQITGGIAEALIATAFGLLIAIVALIPFNYLNARVEEVETEISASGSHLRHLLEKLDAAAKPELVPVAGGV